jgi:hypothetical protein
MKRIFNYNKQESQFSYSVDNFDEIDTSDFFEAVDKTVKDIKKEMNLLNLHKISLLISGIDSEIIAKYIILNDIPVEFYFLHIQGVNDSHKELVELIANKYDVRLNIIKTSFKEVTETIIFETFSYCEIKIPTYLTVPYLIKFTPQDSFVIVGEGDLEKTNVLKYLNVYNNKISIDNSSFCYIPIHLAEIVYTLSLKKYNRYGESNFYSRKFDTWYHILNDSRLQSNYKFYYDPKSKLLNEICKNNFISPIKTLNFTYKNSKSIMDTIEINLKNKESKNWNPYIGDIVVVPRDLLK